MTDHNFIISAYIIPPILMCVLCTIFLVGYFFLRPNPNVKSNLSRFVVVLAWSIVGSVSCGIESIIVSEYFLPPSDGAYGLGVSVLGDPFVYGGMMFLSLPIGFALSPYYFICVDSMSLKKCVPFVQAVALTTVGLVSMLNEFLAMLAGILAVILCLEYLRTARPKYFSTVSAA